MKRKTQSIIDVFGAASSARDHLDDAAIARISSFVSSKMNKDGGFRGRSSASDLYYTFFSLANFAVLGTKTDISRTSAYIRGIDPERLGFIDLYCLSCAIPLVKYLKIPVKLRPVSMSSTMRKMFAGKAARKLAVRLEDYRSKDGGYNQNDRYSDHGTAYAALLACQAYDNLGMEIPDRKGILKGLEGLKSNDGGYSNRPDMPFGTTTATAAAAVLHLYLKKDLPVKLERWLVGQQMSCGGFRAGPQTPIADMLSTATAIFALKQMGHNFKSTRKTVDFVESHWDGSGGFFGSLLDPVCDCEYTFYGLLVLGCLLE